MVKETKLYDQLGISPAATQDEIKKGYRYASFAITPGMQHHLLHLGTAHCFASLMRSSSQRY